MADEWTPLANFLTDMITKYASQLDIDRLKPKRKKTGRKKSKKETETSSVSIEKK